MTTHGKTKHPLYSVWRHMRARCNVKTNSSYKWYGGRGIKVCPEWNKNFQNFYDWATNNNWKKELTLDRINNDGNYEPNNCRFTTRRINCKRQPRKAKTDSGYIGVYKNPKKSKSNNVSPWIANVVNDRKRIHVGTFLTAIEAAIGRDKYIIENKLKYHTLNFEEEFIVKGGSFEGEMSKEFSLYLTHMKTEDGVWRTEASGARATQKQKAKQKLIRPDMFGDITYTIPECKYWFDIFSIECKTGYAKKTKSKKKKSTTVTMWSLMDLIDSQQKMTMFHEFWNQCLNDAIESEREPMLIFRRNRRTPCIAMHNDILAGFMGRFGNPGVNTINVNGDFCYLPVTIMNLRQFFDWTEAISPSIVQNFIVRQLMRRKDEEK